MGCQNVYKLSIRDDELGAFPSQLRREATPGGWAERFDGGCRDVAAALHHQVLPVGDGLHEEPRYHARQSWVHVGEEFTPLP